MTPKVQESLHEFWERQKIRAAERQRKATERRQQQAREEAEERECPRLPPAPKLTVRQVWQTHEDVLYEERRRTYARSL